MAAAVPKPAPDASTLVADPRAWRFFLGIGKVDVRRGAVSLDADVKDDLPVVDLDATWIAQPIEPASQPRALAGARRRDTRAPRMVRSAERRLVDRGPDATRASNRRVDPTPLHRGRAAARRRVFLALAFGDVAGLKAALVTPR